MSDSFRAAVLYENLADLPTTFLRASSAAPFLPAQNLRDQHIGRKWRGLGAAESLFLDFINPIEIDTLALVGCNVTGSVRVRGSNVDSQTEGAPVFDLAVTGGDLRYGYQIVLMAAPVATRFVRIDLNAGAGTVEAGRLVVGLRHQFEVNFAYGWQMTHVDPSPRTKSAGGATHIERKRRFRVLDVNFEHISSAQRWGFVEDMDARVGGSTDVLMISHPDEPNFGQRAIWGLLPEVTPTAESYFNNFAKSYRIEERL